MSLSNCRKFRWPLLSACTVALFCIIAVTQSAQTRFESRTGYVNDFANVLDEPTRSELTTILENLKLKTGIDFAIVTVDSTAGQEIFDFSQKLAREWNVGARSSAKKSLLMVLSVSDRTAFTQFSRSVQADLPEGVLGDVAHRMRAHVEAGRFADGLNEGVKHFVGSMAEKLAISSAEFEQPVSRATAETTTEKRTEPVAIVSSTPIAEPTPVSAPATRQRQVGAAQPYIVTDAADESEEVELTLTLPLEARIAKLKEFLERKPDSKFRGRALELLVSAHAALGDERLKAGDSARGVEELMLAITEASITSSERLFSGVISQIPLNLYVRGERAAAQTAAQSIETKFGNDPKRLLAIAGFYLTTEQGSEAARIANRALTLAPDLADAHQALGLAMHISLRLDEAIVSYKRAVELNPNLKGAQRSLADLYRALGRADEALTIYRQHFAADPKDKGARAGVVLSLLDLGRTEEAKKELDEALQADPANLVLLAGAAYWFAAHNDAQKALELGSKALAIEPRYTWSQVAVARALVAQRNPLAAERAIRFAKQYGTFPTLDYELATTLVAAGLYDEAAEVLMQSFSLKEGQIETSLGGKTKASASSFIELLAPERRASIFQSVGPDSEPNAKLLKDLLAFTTALNQQSINEERAIAAARQFASGDDAFVVHRQLFAASRLMQKGIGYAAAYELTEAARTSADAGLNVPAATVAVQADEYRELRARAISAGGTPEIADAPRNILSNILRGRIEDLSGWALFNQDKPEEAAEHLKRAANILPLGTPAWRTAVWHLGATLERLDQKDEALVQYIRSYNAGEPDPVRRTVIERLYRQVKGSLEGLDEQIRSIGSAPAVTQSATAEPSPSPSAGTSVAGAPVVASPQPRTPTDPVVQPTPEAVASPSPEVATTPDTSTPTNQPGPAVEPTSTPAATPEATPTPTPSRRSSFDPRPDPEPSPTPPAAKPEVKVVTLTGQVRDANKNPVANVVVVLISPQGSVLASTTNEEGVYSFKVAPSTHSYRVIPSKDGFTFDPVDKLLVGASEDQNDLNFIAVAKSP